MTKDERLVRMARSEHSCTGVGSAELVCTWSYSCHFGSVCALCTSLNVDSVRRTFVVHTLWELCAWSRERVNPAVTLKFGSLSCSQYETRSFCRFVTASSMSTRKFGRCSDCCSFANIPSLFVRNEDNYTAEMTVQGRLLLLLPTIECEWMNK